MLRARHITASVVAATVAITAMHAVAAKDLWKKDEEFAYTPPDEQVSRDDLVKLPPYPADEDLVPVPVPQAGDRVNFAVDIRNLTVSKAGVVLYTIVIETDRGARNVLFEGIDCADGEFKGYGYGRRRQDIVASGGEWRSVTKSGTTAYRGELQDGYFCSGHGYPIALERIRARLQGNAGYDARDTR